MSMDSINTDEFVGELAKAAEESEGPLGDLLEEAGRRLTDLAARAILEADRGEDQERRLERLLELEHKLERRVELLGRLLEGLEELAKAGRLACSDPTMPIPEVHHD